MRGGFSEPRIKHRWSTDVARGIGARGTRPSDPRPSAGPGRARLPLSPIFGPDPFVAFHPCPIRGWSAAALPVRKCTDQAVVKLDETEAASSTSPSVVKHEGPQS